MTRPNLTLSLRAFRPSSFLHLSLASHAPHPPLLSTSMSPSQNQNFILVCAEFATAPCVISSPSGADLCAVDVPGYSGKRLSTDKINLVASSVVLRTMFDLGSSDEQAVEVPVTEKAEVMEKVLPYCGPGKVPFMDIAADPDGFWSVARVCDKYEVSEETLTCRSVSLSDSDRRPCADWPWARCRCVRAQVSPPRRHKRVCLRKVRPLTIAPPGSRTAPTRFQPAHWPGLISLRTTLVPRTSPKSSTLSLRSTLLGPS
jgi:hypothetical protein